MPIEVKGNIFLDKNIGFYYTAIREENLEETLDLIVDVQLYNPGNPLFVTLKIDP
jgi:hypothetical protein